ncbi:type II toxin-antitoxin system VapC family toxin [Rhizorhabdus argentea]|uniref:type II toxin-antitoxin system VapC family toxin n=1 Tax=Rhizorhabdus argentea TaxID=1387174 RepID=UPI0030EE4D7A
MRAIDTNIVVRFLTGDDKIQADAARAIFEGGDIFISLTVLLESEWVLRGAYGFPPERIAEKLAGIASLPGVSAEEPMLLATAIDWMRAGMDFADALHLAKAGGYTSFVSFDRKLAKVAKGRSAVPVETP